MLGRGMVSFPFLSNIASQRVVMVLILELLVFIPNKQEPHLTPEQATAIHRSLNLHDCMDLYNYKDFPSPKRS